MGKERMLAFSDGVIAIIITVMVLEFKVPHGADLSALQPLIPSFITYALSFVFIGIYWNNHHHLLHGVQKINGGILWANLHLLFWLSLIPFVTRWIAENRFNSLPVAFYGITLLLAGIAYLILTKALLALHGKSSALATALGRTVKEKLSVVIYLIAIALAFFMPFISYGLYAIVALMWLIPDRRIERTFSSGGADV